MLDTTQILADVENSVSVSCVVPQSMGLPFDKYTVVKAGTPLVLNLMDTVKIAKPAGEYDPEGGGGKTPARWIAVYSPTLDLRVDLEKAYKWLEDNCTQEEFNYMWTYWGFDSRGSEANLRTRTSSYYWKTSQGLRDDIGIEILSGNKQSADIYMPFFNYMLNPFIKNMTSVDNLTFTDVSKYLRVISSGYLGRNNRYGFFTEMTFTKLIDGNAEIKANGSTVATANPYNFEEIVSDMGFAYDGNFAVGDTIVAKMIDGDLPPKSKMNAILLHDVDVTEEDGNGTALVFGIVNTNRVSSMVRSTLIEAAKEYDGHALKCAAL